MSGKSSKLEKHRSSCNSNYSEEAGTTNVIILKKNDCHPRPTHKKKRGPMGFQGAVGPQGLMGFQGIIGNQGIMGVQGVIGHQGIMGMQGNIGPQGIMGVQGLIGPQGKCVMGVQGIQGPQGIMGNQGMKGMQGNIGPQGLMGFQGMGGIQGNIGQQGLMGFQGDCSCSKTTYINLRAKDFIKVIKGVENNQVVITSIDQLPDIISGTSSFPNVKNPSEGWFLPIPEITRLNILNSTIEYELPFGNGMYQLSADIHIATITNPDLPPPLNGNVKLSYGLTLAQNGEQFGGDNTNFSDIDFNMVTGTADKYTHYCASTNIFGPFDLSGCVLKQITISRNKADSNEYVGRIYVVAVTIKTTYMSS